MKIAFLGPEGSYSHVAAQYFLKAESQDGAKGVNFDECIPFRNFLEVSNSSSLSFSLSNSFSFSR